MSPRPYVWQMIAAAIDHLGGPASYQQIRDYIHQHWGEVNDRTINAHLISCCVNQPSRVHYPRNSRPRIANRPFDLLYSTERGWVERYDLQRHGVWEIRVSPSGDLAAPRVGGGTASPAKGLVRAQQPVSPSSAEQHSLCVRSSLPTSPAREIPMPTVQDLNSATYTFLRNETRQAFYDTAKRSVAAALAARDTCALRRALWELLRTWNKEYYHWHPVSEAHFLAIDDLLRRTWDRFSALRSHALENATEDKLSTVPELFREFQQVLGPVGAAKALHLLAPHLLPIWDRRIAKTYGLYLPGGEKNVRDYCRFVRIARQQVLNFGGEKALGRNPLKALDEYNYCRFSKGWSQAQPPVEPVGRLRAESSFPTAESPRNGFRP